VTGLNALPQRVTVDGFVVHVGHIVWRDRCGVRQRRLDRYDITWAWQHAYEGKCYVSERACIEAAIATRKKQIAKAKSEIRSAEAYAAKLISRLAGLVKT
jgi:hypothetical protein